MPEAERSSPIKANHLCPVYPIGACGGAETSYTTADSLWVLVDVCFWAAARVPGRHSVPSTAFHAIPEAPPPNRIEAGYWILV